MKWLSHSNGIYKVEKEKISMLKILKICIAVLAALLVLGFAIQLMTNFIDNQRLKSRFKYVRIDGKKMEYKIKGNGEYTIVFDGSLGADMYQWDNVCKNLEENKGVTTFTYNRRGYGFNDGGEIRTPEDQAKDLKSLLRKAGAPEPYIMVSEQYGSLVATNFEKLYPKSVAGLVLINPIEEESLSDQQIKSQIRKYYIRSKIETIGANFSLTSLLSKFNLTIRNTTFEQDLSGTELEEYNALKNKKNYREAISNELYNLYNCSSKSQSESMLIQKPLYIIGKEDISPLEKIGDPNFTKVYKLDNNEEPYSVTNYEAIITGINSVIKDAKKINKSQ